MELFKLLGKVSIDVSEANKDLDNTTNKAKDSEKEQSKAFKKIGESALTVGKGIVGVGAVLGGAFIAATEGTREYRASMGQLETAFITQGHSATTAKITYTALNSVLGDTDQAVEASQQLAMLTNNQKDLDTMTNALTGVYATFGDALPIEGLAEAANHTAKVGEVQGNLADALEWSGVSVDSFNKQLGKCSTEQERQKLITSTLNDLYGKQGAKYKEVNKDVIDAEKANGKLTDAMAELGKIGEPIITAIKDKIGDMATAAIPKIKTMVDKIKDMVKWFKENKNTVDAWVAVIIVATATLGGFILLFNWATIMKKAATAIQTVTVAMKALNVAMKANLIGLIVSLIVGLVAAFIYLWKNNEGFRNFWLKMWDKIKSVTSTAVSWIKSKFNALKDVVSNVKDKFDSIKKTITDKINGAKDAVKNAVEKIKSFFNTTLKFKGLKMPSIKLTMEKGSGLMAKAAELLGLSGVPKFSVKWNAEGFILDKPAIVGIKGNELLGGGEAGPEALTPISKLTEYVAEAVDSRNATLIRNFEIQISRLISFIAEYFPTEYKIMLDTGVLVGEMDSKLGDRYKFNTRFNR